ncbi:MAG: hypothetical protein HY841_15695 [Bacteroidetes bacterium]|nr:hypothetical protein [Bacteroidota bacterium]
MKSGIFHVRNFVFILSIFFCKNIFSQQTAAPATFQITNNGTAADIQPYKDAINNANMENYRCKTKRNTILFDNGLKAELISAGEMLALGKNVNINQYSDTRDPLYIQPVFHLNDNGTLSAMYSKPNMKQNTIIK